MLKSDLEIPPQIGKFLGLYLLFHIGIVGGQELSQSGLSETLVLVMITCVAFSFIMPVLAYKVLRFKMGQANSAAISASYGSVSAVTFATALTFLSYHHQSFNGFMVLGLALMEVPAILSGLIIYKLCSKNNNDKKSFGRTIKESLLSGSIVLLIGALIIGFLSGPAGQQELKPFVTGIFKGMLSFYMLDLGILCGKNIGSLKKGGLFIVLFAILFPLFGATCGIAASLMLNLGLGNALLLTILAGSASYIAVPAAMRLAIPDANMGILLPMTIVITFSLNITIGIPVYYHLLQILL